MPLQRRLPKRGFHNPFRTEYSVVNLGQLGTRFESGATVDPEALRASGLVHGAARPIKILAGGELNKALSVKAHKFSAAASERLTALGGSAEVISGV
jgi:large subunit ribosomal protein L15